MRAPSPELGKPLERYSVDTPHRGRLDHGKPVATVDRIPAAHLLHIVKRDANVRRERPKRRQGIALGCVRMWRPRLNQCLEVCNHACHDTQRIAVGQ